MNFIQPVLIGKEKVKLKHLQFANDTIIIAPKSQTVITNYFRILDVFAIMTGLNLNYSKSCFTSWNASDQSWASETARNMGCPHSMCPFTYLGFPLGDHMNRRSAWKPVIQKIQMRLALWKAKILSRAGRLTLIKSVLNSLPVYYTSMFKMPKAVAQEIVSLERKFFWSGANNENRGCPRIKLSDIELPKEMGGLGVGNIMHKNLILLFKWWWRYSEANNSLWKRILQSVYNIKGLKASTDTFHNVKNGTWAHLLSSNAETSKMRSIIEEGMGVKIGNGQSVSFWHDTWCDGGALKRIFPKLYTISLQKNLLISQMGIWQEESWVWQLSWRRNLYDWEQDQATRLETLIQQFNPDRNMEDSMVWKHSGSMVYPTKIIGEKMLEDIAPILEKPIINHVWQKFIPPRVQLTIWLANLERLKTGDFLLENGIIDAQRATCPFCSTGTESNSHILFTCNFSWRSWMEILKWWGISAALQNQCSNFSRE